MMKLKEASLKAEADFQHKQEHALEQIDRLRQELAALSQEKNQLDRQLELVREEIAKERKLIGREKQQFRDLIDETLASR